MNRRKLLKSIGILSFIGAGTILSESCKEEKPKITKKVENPSTKNRQPMKIKDVENPTNFELKHTPEIILGDKDAKGFTKIEITVGSKGIIHPTKKDHWIDYLKLYKNDSLVGEYKIEPGMARGFSGFRIDLKDAKQLKAVIGCNLHGIWESTLVI